MLLLLLLLLKIHSLPGIIFLTTRPAGHETDVEPAHYDFNDF